MQINSDIAPLVELYFVDSCKVDHACNMISIPPP